MAEVETHERFPSGQLLAGWEALVGADPAATVFHLPRFLAVWFEHLGGRRRLHLRTVWEGKRLTGVVPETRELEGSPTGPRMLVRFAGGEDVTDYLGPVAAPEDRDAVIASWIDLLADDPAWDELIASGLAEDAGWHDLVAAHAERAGLAVIENAVEASCPRVDVSGGWEAYLEALPGKHRQELRRKARRLAREAGSVGVVEVAAEDLPAALDTFVELHRQAEGTKASFFDDERLRRFFGGLVGALGSDGTLRVHTLVVNGATAASAITFVHGAEWGLYNSAFDVTLRRLSPGIVLVGELIRLAAESGAGVFDLLRGDEPYKYGFGASERRVRRVTVLRRS